MSSARQYRLAAGVLTGLGTAFYFAGLVLPMATLTKKFLPFVNTTDSYNLLQTIRNLFRDGDNLLGVILVLFTFVFPVTKFFSLFMGLLAGWNDRNSRLYKIMKATGRWSMLDVFVVAILVVMLRVETMGGGLAMQARPGIYCFGASVLLAIWSGLWIDRVQREEAALAAQAARGTAAGAASSPAAAAQPQPVART